MLNVYLISSIICIYNIFILIFHLPCECRLLVFSKYQVGKMKIVRVVCRTINARSATGRYRTLHNSK